MHGSTAQGRLMAAYAMAALCGATLLLLSTDSLPSWTAGSLPLRGGSSSEQAAGLLLSRPRPARVLLERGESSATDHPVPRHEVQLQRLDWLREPEGGWATWQHVDGSQEGGVKVAAASGADLQEQAVRGVNMAHLVVLQVTSHLSTGGNLLGSMSAPRLEFSTRAVPNTTENSELPDHNMVAIAAAEAAKGDAASLSTAAFAKPKQRRRPPPISRRRAPPRPIRRQKLPARPSPKPVPSPPTPRPSMAESSPAQTPVPSPSPVMGLPVLPNTIERDTGMPPPFHGNFPPTGLSAPPAPRPGGCLVSDSVLRFGARGNSQASEVAALRLADKSASTRLLYFPPGVYRITADLILNKPVIMGLGTRFEILAGVKLTLATPPRRAPNWNDPMFIGAGRVLMGARVTEVYPAWWSDIRLSDDEVFQRAVRSCMAACTVVQSRTLFLKRAVTLTPTAGILATAHANIMAAPDSTGEGLVLPSGIYNRPLVFSSVRGFSRFGIKLMGGVRNANIQAGHVTDNVEGILFQGVPGTTIFNTSISHVSVMQGNQQSVAFAASGPGATMHGVTIRVNFLLTGGFKNPNAASAGVLFRGTVPELKRAQVIVQAIDPAQFLMTTRFVAVATRTPGPVSNFVFRSDCWNGGYAQPGGQVVGAFRDSHFRIAFSDAVGGNMFSFQAGSRNNYISKQDTSAPSAFWSLVPAPGSLQQFVAANPSPPPQPMPMQFAGPSRHQVFWVNVKTEGTWSPGQQRTYYLHAFFADPAANAKMSCAPFLAFNPGLYCLQVTSAPIPYQRHRVAVKLINLSKKVIPTQTTHYFGVQIGPG